MVDKISDEQLKEWREKGLDKIHIHAVDLLDNLIMERSKNKKLLDMMGQFLSKSEFRRFVTMMAVNVKD